MSCKIKDLCKIIGSGGTPSRKNKFYYDSGNIKWLKTKELDDGNIYDTEEKITEEGLKKSSAKLYPKDTIVMAMYGATVGKLGILKEEMCTNQACCNMVVDNNKCNFKFLYYSLLYNRENLINLANGAAQQNLSVGVIGDYEINLPNLEEQEKISNILSSLDDKIELNNDMNKTLEEMAQSIFKRWFVDFEFPNEYGEPYKSSGGEMVDSEIGMIPNGWEVKDLGDTDIIIEDGDRGKNYPNKSQLLKSGYCPFLNNKNIINDKISLLDSDFITEERHNLLRKGKVNINDIILTTRGSIGNIGIFNKYLGYEFARINSGMVILKNREEFNLMYLYQLLKSHSMKEQYKSMATGTAQPQLPIKDIKKLKILKPSKNIQDKIGSLLGSIYDLVFSNNQESLNISIKRDTLLPNLMSGEISVN